MALFIIIAGSLLLLGGATSLLFGFDIVMTERGNAMTIAGTIALSGGIVAIGIGLALLRLTQILRALESNRPRQRLETTGSTRPVVPTAGVVVDTHSAPSLDMNIVDPDQKPRNVAPTLAPTLAPPLALGAGIAAVAGVAGGIAVSVRERAEDSVEQLTALPAETAAETGMATPLELPDLEAELSRALAETSTEISPTDTAHDSFNDNLANLLKKPKDRKRKQPFPIPPEDEAVLQDQAQNQAEDVVPVLKSTVDEPEWLSGATKDPLDLEAVRTEIDSASTAEHEHPPEMEVSAQETSDNDISENSSVTEEMIPVSASDGDQRGEEIMSPKKPDIIGSYKIGDNAYTMFSDGSVEETTEDGIKRFESMDALRRHLAKS